MTSKKAIELVECPRDAIQGWSRMIPTAEKIAYLNQLLKVGFHTLDFGSFVSPKAVPQMADTAEVLAELDLTGTNTKLLAIVANERGAEQAVSYQQVSCLGFPFSVSPTFQQRNTNASMAEAMERVKHIVTIARQHQRQLVVYLSMAFGNPYGDEYNASIVRSQAEQIAGLGVKIISLADTTGLANSEEVYDLTSAVTTALPEITIGVHLHAAPLHWKDKLQAALRAGCFRIDGALKGIGGCPFAGDELVGNLDTERIIPYLKNIGWLKEINDEELVKASLLANSLFSKN